MPSTLKTILKPDIQRIFDHFSACFTMRIVFFNLQGEKVIECRNRTDSNYCTLLRRYVFGLDACQRFDHAQCEKAACEGHLLCYECHAGLTEAVMPISYNGQLLGYVAIGQLRPRHHVPPHVADAWNATGRDRAELENAYHALPFASPQQIDAIIGLFSLVVDYIVSQHMIAVGGNTALENLLAYMEEHLDEDITVEEAARVIDRSPSTVSHLFAKHLGVSFKQMLIEMKLRRAEDYMRAHPACRVADAAASVGYADPLYFSRLYRRYRPVPPSAFLASVQP